MANIGAKNARDFLSRRIRSAAIVTAVLTSTFMALAINQGPNEPQSSLPTATVLSPWAVLDPSTSANDKDGFPPTQSSADPEEAFLLGQITTDNDIYSPSAKVLDSNFDAVDDLMIDDDSPRNLDMLDGLSDGKLAAGTYYVYWNLNKTGYVPVNTTPGSDYNGSNSASLSLVNDQEKFQLELTFSTTEGGSLQTVTSALYMIEMWKAASIGQNDLDWIDTQPKVVIAEPGDLFHVRSKYSQSSAQGMEWFVLQCYFNGLNIRMRSVSLYYYDNFDPGSIVDGVPSGYAKSWTNKQQYTGAELGDTNNKDFWVTDYTFEVREMGYSEVIPYIQTKKGGDSWKVDSGYAGFQSHVPGGVNPAVLDISKYFSESYEGGVVSGPNPPIVGETTVYEIGISISNTGADDCVNVVVTDTVKLDHVEWLGIYTVSQGTLSYNPLTGKITWSVGSLLKTNTATLTYQVSVTPTPDLVGYKILLNSGAYATGKSKTSGATITDGPTDPLYTEPVIGLPEMTVTKTADQDTADPGDLITYNLHYANSGSSAAFNVVIKDIIPEHVTYVSSFPTYDSVSGRTYTWNIGEVAAGASGDVTITVQVDAGTPDGTVLANLGRVEYEGPGGPEPPDDSWKNITVTAPDMTFSKTADVTTADPGDLIVYTLAYHNTGTGEATSVVIVDTIPEHVTFISSVPTPSSVSGRVYTFNIGTVAGGASGTVTITVKVNAGTPDGTVLENVAVLNYDDANGNPYPEEPDSTTTTVTAPVITFDKCADVSQADPGDQITYTLSYHNTGTGAASSVVIKDTIPEHVTFISSVPTPSSVSGRVYTYNIGSLAPGASGTITIVVKVNAGTPDGTSLVNVATFNYKDPNGNPYPEKSDCATTTVTAPVVTFDKSVDKTTANPGDTITYTLTAKNTGTGTATGAVLKDTIPLYTTFYSATPNYNSVSGRTYTWNLGDMTPGETKTVTLKVKVDAYTADQTVLTNTATFDYKDANGNSYPQLSDSASTTVTSPMMTFQKVANVAYADPGDQITYTITYFNGGSGKATDVEIKDTIPESTTFVSSNPAYTSVSGRTYTWWIGDLLPSSGGSITVVVSVNAGTPDGTVLTNLAKIWYEDPNGNPYGPMSSTATTTVTAPVFSFCKSADVQTADPGDIITYTLYYKNTGSGVATGVVIKDTIPEHTTYYDSDPAYSSVSGRTYTWNIGTVNGGAEGEIILQVKVDAGTADQLVLTNTATLDYKDANGNPLPQKCDDASTTVTAPVMTFSKDVDAAFADPGDLLVYTLSYKNTGTGVATGVVVEDTIPMHTTFQTSTPAYSGVSGRTYTWNIGTVNPGVSGSITITVKVDAGTADKTVLTNTATLYYDDANGNEIPQKSDDAQTTVTSPVMQLSKTADKNMANPGDTVIYTITYKNTGTGIATGVVVVDTLPTYVTFVDAVPYPDSISGNVLTWDVGDVAAGTTASITIKVTVNARVPDGEVLHNVATLDYDDANGNPYQQLTACWDIVTTSPVMSFSKNADVSSADPGDEIVYTLHYANSGTGSASDVVVTDTIPEHVSFVTASPYPDSISGRVLTWNIGTVGPDSDGDIFVTVQVDAYVADGTVLVNTATMDYDDANGNPYDQMCDDAKVTVTAPILHVNKVADVQEADPGDYITYTITYYNSGSGIATGVVISDTIPEHVTFITSSPSYDSVLGRKYTWDIGTVSGNGGGGSITIVVKVDVGTPDATLLHNVATLDYDDANGNPYQQLTDDADVTVTAPVVDLTKVADVAFADPGDQIEYTVEFTNTGSGMATDVTVKDTIPEHVTFVSSTPEYSGVSGRTYTWHWNSVSPGTTITITIVVEVDAYTADQTLLHNVAKADYDDDNGNPYQQLTAYADVMVTAPVFGSFYKVSDVGFADPGDYITYAINYQNTGTGWASDVVIRDTIPDFVDFITSSPPQSSASGQIYSWAIGDVAPGDFGQIIITVKVMVGTLDQTLLHNVATLDYSDANGNPYPQMSDYADVIVTAPVMSFSKTADVETADPGDLITYSLCYANTGTGVASNVVVSDTLPADVTLQSSTPPYDSQVGNTFSWEIGVVSGGGSGCIVIVAKVNPGTADKTVLHNTASLNYADANGNPYPQLNDYNNVQVTAPVMTFTKVADVTLADPGDYVTYTLAYENIGTGDASGVTIVDTLPDEMTFISASSGPDSIIGQVLTWYIGDVGSMVGGSITVLVQVNPGTPDKTPLHNVATMDYSDANGNFIEQLTGSADVTVTAPVMTFDKEAGEVTVGAYVIANFTIRIAGEKWHDVRLTVFDNGVPKYLASVTRFPGSPDEQSVTLYHVKINLIGTFTAAIVYTPIDDPLNGQWWGDDPCWLILTFPSGNDKRLFHNFNVRHEDTWIWTIDDFRAYTKGEPVIYEATIPYKLTYENIGTGDASNVVVSDLFPAGSVFLNSSPPYDSIIGDVYTWLIGYVASGAKGYVFINISYVFDVNNTVVTNYAALEYSDANGNFIETLLASADAVLIMPEIDYGKKGYSIDYGLVSLISPGQPLVKTLPFGTDVSGPTSARMQPVTPTPPSKESGPIGAAMQSEGDRVTSGGSEIALNQIDVPEPMVEEPQSGGPDVAIALTGIPVTVVSPVAGTLTSDGPDTTTAAKELSLADGAATSVVVDVSLMLMSIVLLLGCAFSAAWRIVTGRK